MKALLRGQKENENEPEGRKLTINMKAYVTFFTCNLSTFAKKIHRNYRNIALVTEQQFVKCTPLFKNHLKCHHLSTNVDFKLLLNYLSPYKTKNCLLGYESNILGLTVRFPGPKTKKTISTSIDGLC